MQQFSKYEYSMQNYKCTFIAGKRQINKIQMLHSYLLLGKKIPPPPPNHPAPEQCLNRVFCNHLHQSVFDGKFAFSIMLSRNKGVVITPFPLNKPHPENSLSRFSVTNSMEFIRGNMVSSSWSSVVIIFS